MASKRHVRRKTCGKKVRYADQQAAIKACGAMYRMKHTRMRPYKCKYCKQWHIGHARLGLGKVQSQDVTGWH